MVRHHPKQVSVVTGDDAAVALAVGAGLEELRALYRPRVAQLEEHVITPIDELGRSVDHARQELERLQQRQLYETRQLWDRYKPGS